MTSYPQTPYNKVHSSSSEGKILTSSNFFKKINNNAASKDALNNHVIHLPCNDEDDIISQSSNLTFYLKTLVPTNTPNIYVKNDVFDFNQIEVTKPIHNAKNAILNRIKQLKQNSENEQPPNYLKSLVSRKFFVEKFSKSPGMGYRLENPFRSSELRLDTQNEQFIRTTEDPKKLEIKKSVNKWTNHFKTQREGDSDIEFQNEIRNNLNKLTPDNYEIIRQIILERVRNSEVKCEFLVKKIIEKAWNEQKYTKVYAELCNFFQNCKELESEEESSNKETSAKLKKKKNIFRSVLLGSIQSSFEEDHDYTTDTMLDKQCLATLKKKKIFGIVKFIGELFLIKVLPEIIIQLCATTMFFKLFQEFKKDIMMPAFESNLEGIIILYDLVGKFLDKNEHKSKKTDKNLNLLNQIKQELLSCRKTVKPSPIEAIFSFVDIFSLLEFFVKNLDLNKRLQILIQNLVEKRKAQWKERTFSNEIPKKISELHQEYKLEQEISANINPYNRIVITSQIPLEKKPKHCSINSSETKSTDGGTPVSITDNYEVYSKIKKCLNKYKAKNCDKDRVYECLKKLLMRTNKKNLILCKFLQSFYNDVTMNVEQILFIPFKLFEENYINKMDFLEAFNQSFQIVWEDVGDNPKLLDFLSKIFNDFTKNQICFYEDLEFNEVKMKENEEFREVFEEFIKNSLSLLNNQKLSIKLKEALKNSLQTLSKKKDFST